MKTEVKGGYLLVYDVAELNVVNFAEFGDLTARMMPKFPIKVDIDLRQTRFVDSSGLGALFMLYKRARGANEEVELRILNSRPSIQQLFELTQLHQLFEISKSS